MAAQFYYSESCCPALLFAVWFLLVVPIMLPWDLTVSTNLRLTLQITAWFLWTHTHVHCASRRVVACRCICLSARVIPLCARTAHSPLIDLLNRRVSEDSCRKAFLISGKFLISSTGTGGDMLLQMVQGTDFPLSSWDCFLWRLLSFNRESESLRIVGILVPSGSLLLVPAEAIDGGESSDSPGWLAVGELTGD